MDRVKGLPAVTLSVFAVMVGLIGVTGATGATGAFPGTPGATGAFPDADTTISSVAMPLVKF